MNHERDRDDMEEGSVDEEAVDRETRQGARGGGGGRLGEDRDRGSAGAGAGAVDPEVADPEVADPEGTDPGAAAPAADPDAGDPAGDEPALPFAVRRPARSGAAAGAGAARAEAAPPAASDAPADPTAESFGSWLRRQREMREIELREIAERTKISMRYLKALEQDRFDVLPAPVFARGFLREYARYVGLNPDDVVNYYLSIHEGADDEEDEPSPTPERRGPALSRVVVAVLVLLAVLAVAYLWFYQRSQEPDAGSEQRPPMAVPTGTVAEPPPEPPPEPAPEPASTAPLVVTLDFTQKCWVEARADDQRRVSRLFAAGESLQLEARDRVVLETLGNVAGVRVQVNGEPYPLPEARGNSVRGVVIVAPGDGAAAAALDPVAATGDGRS